MPNFSSLAGLEVAGKFVVVCGGVEHVTTMSNSNASCFRVVLSWVELRWVLTKVSSAPGLRNGLGVSDLMHNGRIHSRSSGFLTELGVK